MLAQTKTGVAIQQMSSTDDPYESAQVRSGVAQEKNPRGQRGVEGAVFAIGDPAHTAIVRWDGPVTSIGSPQMESRALEFARMRRDGSPTGFSPEAPKVCYCCGRKWRKCVTGLVEDAFGSLTPR